MRTFRSFVLIVAPLAFAAACSVRADSPEPAPIVDDPDYAVQGEYVGARHSMQVIAEGDGEFQIVVYEGGLPPRKRSGNPPRRLTGDEDTVLQLVESLELKTSERVSSTLGADPPATRCFNRPPRRWDGRADCHPRLTVSPTNCDPAF
jgi:hypothetical protein